jgi:hypothetical protein
MEGLDARFSTLATTFRPARTSRLFANHLKASVPYTNCDRGWFHIGPRIKPLALA